MAAQLRQQGKADEEIERLAARYNKGIDLSALKMADLMHIPPRWSMLFGFGY